MNKTAEKVLKCIIKKSNNKLDEPIVISHRDFNNKSITNNLLNSVCEQLYNEGYLGNCYISCDEDDDIDVILKYEGYAYFDNKRKTNFRFWVPIFISNFFALAALVISIISLMK